MAEWLIENGIGEERAILLDRGEVVAARLRWPGGLEAGLIDDATLIARSTGSRRGTARFASGEEALVDGLPRDAGEGAPIRLQVTRSAMAERGRLKRAQARPTEAAKRPAPGLAASLGGTLVAHFPTGLWEELVSEAADGEIDFAGGKLTISPTPALTVIDIDGDLPPRGLALAAVPAIAAAVRRFDLAGSIGIDFPTLQEKEDRKAVDEALAAALSGWPHERTAMNGFGFVQLVARLEGPSLLHRFASSRTGMAARMALRRAERVEGAGVTLLTVHPALKANIKDDWLTELERRTGRPLRIETDPGLAIEAGAAQIVGHD